MKISIEDKSGFCFGVVRVIAMAEDLLKSGEKVWCLGQIVHNEAEVDRLTRLGMGFIDHTGLQNLHNAKLLIRAHGEPPSTYETARRNNLEVIEGTCPIVQRLQKDIQKGFTSQDENDLSIVIFGKANHPEVIGLVGQANEKALVIGSVEEAMRIPLNMNVSLFSQTTMDASEFERIADTLKTRVSQSGGTLQIKKSICGHVSHRKPGLVRFARENDVIVFVGGKKSSNAHVLYEICRKENSNSYFISTPGELDRKWFYDARSTGICGATSTPVWQLDAVSSKIKEMIKS